MYKSLKKKIGQQSARDFLELFV